MGMSMCVGFGDEGGQWRRSFVELRGDAASSDEVVEKRDESLISVALQVASPGVVRWQRLRQVPTGESSGVPHRSCPGLDYPVPQSCETGQCTEHTKDLRVEWDSQQVPLHPEVLLCHPCTLQLFPTTQDPTSDIELGASARVLLW